MSATSTNTGTTNRSTIQRLGPSIVWFGLSGALFASSILWAIHKHPSFTAGSGTTPRMTVDSSSSSSSSTVPSGTTSTLVTDDDHPSSSFYTDDPETITSITLFIMGDRYSQLAAASLVLSFAWLLFQCCTFFSLGPLRPLEDAGIIKELQERLITNFSFRLLVLLVIISDIVFLHSWVLPFSWYTAITGLFALSLMSKRRLELFIQENNQYQQHPTSENYSLVSTVSRPFIIRPGSNLRTILGQHFSRLFILCLVMVINIGLLVALVIGLSSPLKHTAHGNGGGSLHLLVLLMADNVSIILKTLHTTTIYVTYLYTASTNHPYSNTSLSTIEAWRRDINEYADIGFDGGSISVQLLHLLHIWYLHGLSFSLVDMVLLLNVKSCITLLRTRWQAFSSYYNLNKQLDSLCVNATLDQLRTKRKKSNIQEDANDRQVSSSVSNTQSTADSYDGVRHRGESSSSNKDHPDHDDTSKPTKFAKKEMNDDDDYDYEECAICLETLRQAKRLPVCGHMFHRHCLRGWLLAPATNTATANSTRSAIPAHRTCPLCRTAIDPQDIETQRRQQQEARTNAPAYNDNNNPAPARPANNLVNNMMNHPLWTQLGLAFTGEDTTIDQDFQTLTEMFPHIAPQALRQHRTVAGSIHLTIDAALRGILPTLPDTTPTVPTTIAAPALVPVSTHETGNTDTIAPRGGYLHSTDPSDTESDTVSTTVVWNGSMPERTVIVSSSSIPIPHEDGNLSNEQDDDDIVLPSSHIDQGLASILAVANRSPTSPTSSAAIRTFSSSSSSSRNSTVTYDSTVPSPVASSPSIPTNPNEAVSPEDKRNKERELRARAAEARLQSRQ